VGQIPIVLFEPNDLMVVLGGPGNRRTLVDLLLSQLDKNYMVNLARYRRLLKQRNSLLHAMKRGYAKPDELFVINLQMVEPIRVLVSSREALIKNLFPYVTQNYQVISQTSEKVLFSYNASLPTEKDYIIRELEKASETDVRLGYSTLGPHRDKINLSLHNYISSESMSRGEVRTLILALKLSELNYLNDQLENPPLLLLDDVLSELDSTRQKHLWQATKNYQTIITATHLEKGQEIPGHQVIKLS
jgi:DNA replication and repair protein RecF